MRRILTLLACATLATATMGQDGCDTADTGDPVTTGNPGQATEDTSAKPPAARISARNCDYLLGDFSEGPGGFRFAAAAKVTNTGGGPVRVKVTAKWEQLGATPIRESKTVAVGEGKSRRVRFNIPATQDQIDLHQSADSECGVTGKLVS